MTQYLIHQVNHTFIQIMRICLGLCNYLFWIKDVCCFTIRLVTLPWVYTAVISWISCRKVIPLAIPWLEWARLLCCCNSLHPLLTLHGLLEKHGPFYLRQGFSPARGAIDIRNNKQTLSYLSALNIIQIRLIPKR